MVNNVLPCDKDIKFFATTSFSQHKKVRFRVHKINYVIQTPKNPKFFSIFAMSKYYIEL